MNKGWAWGLKGTNSKVKPEKIYLTNGNIRLFHRPFMIDIPPEMENKVQWTQEYLSLDGRIIGFPKIYYPKGLRWKHHNFFKIYKEHGLVVVARERVASAIIYNGTLELEFFGNGVKLGPIYVFANLIR